MSLGNAVNYGLLPFRKYLHYRFRNEYMSINSFYRLINKIMLDTKSKCSYDFNNGVYHRLISRRYSVNSQPITNKKVCLQNSGKFLSVKIL